MSEKRILEWIDNLSSGDVALDAHTKEFLRQANDFFDMRVSPYRYEKLEQILGFLIDYSKNHFPAQEDIMKRTNYPSISTHTNEHRVFIKSISRLYKQLLIQKKPKVDGDTDYDDRGLDGVITDTYDFIINWYDSHLLGSDKRLYDYVKYEFIHKSI